MLLKSIKLESFRPYANKTFSFNQGLTIIEGPNTSGKTSLLEGIFLGATGRSFRTSQDTEMIKESDMFSKIRIELNNNTTILELILTRGYLYGKRVATKKFFVNNIPRRAIDFVGYLKASLFWPEDMALVIGSPGTRRRYLDLILSQTDREYHRCLRVYEKGLRQRNKLLFLIREGEREKSDLDYWNELVIKNGSYITEKRSEFISSTNKFKSPIGHRNFTLYYDNSEISYKRIEKYQQEEVAAASTLVGPHRDDIIFYLDSTGQKKLAHFGSRGEQRLGVLWFKLAELSYIESKTSVKPLLLLDDIFSELDETNRQVIIKCIQDHQTIITTAEPELIDKKMIKSGQLIKLK